MTPSGSREVDLQAVCQTGEVDLDVGDLLGHGGSPGSRVEIGRLRLGAPLEDLDQLGGFHREGPVAEAEPGA